MGKLVCQNGFTYKGEFFQGFRHGRGIAQYQMEGAVYEG